MKTNYTFWILDSCALGETWFQLIKWATSNSYNNYAISIYLTWVQIPLRWGVLDTTLFDQVCQWFSPSTLVSSTNKTDRHDITEILLKVVLNTITLILKTNYTLLNLESCALRETLFQLIKWVTFKQLILKIYEINFLNFYAVFYDLFLIWNFKHKIFLVVYLFSDHIPTACFLEDFRVNYRIWWIEGRINHVKHIYHLMGQYCI